jgi:hypothetical protein
MKNINKILTIIIPIIAIILFFIFFLGLSDEVNEYNFDIFEVENPNDDARSFTVIFNVDESQTEDGAWALLQLSPSYSFGVRFNNVTIPKNATINNAYVELFSIGTPGHLHPNCKIYCDDIDNSVNFSVYGVLNNSGRNYTTNYEYWNSTVTYGEWIKTPSITSCIKEVISRSNWTSGNSISVLFISEGIRGYASAFQNYENGYPVKLYIEWKDTI